MDDHSSYLWEVAGKPVRVSLPFDLMDRIAAEAERGLAMAPSGAEVGGILLGSVEPGNPHLVLLESLAPVRCEYRYGPSFILTEKDEQYLAADLERLRTERPEVRPVGFFRTQPRGGLSLSEQDLWLFATHFSAPHEVALIVTQRSGQSPLGAFFFWENGNIKSDAAVTEFPLDPDELAGGTAKRDPARKDEQKPGASIPDQRRVLPPLPPSLLEAAEPEPRARRVRIPGLANPATLAAITASLVLAGGILGFAAGWLWRHEPAAAVPRDPYALSLSVSQYGDNLHVKWDRTAPAIASAGRGQILISDGDQTRPIELGREQLRKGSVVYRRVTPDVKLRLEVFLNGRDSIAEWWQPPAR